MAMWGFLDRFGISVGRMVPHGRRWRNKISYALQLAGLEGEASGEHGFLGRPMNM
jgi:hypothetical protein